MKESTQKNINNPNGFTLIETLVAVTILAIATAGPLYTANRALVAAQTTKYQLIASYLAQEGIEQVRQMRDNEYLALYNNDPSGNASVDAWTNFLKNNVSDSNSVGHCIASTCRLNPWVTSGNPLQQCSGNSCAVSLNTGNGQYYQDGTSGPTIVYARTIQLTQDSNTEESVIATVTFVYHNQSYAATIIDHLTPWQ